MHLTVLRVLALLPLVAARPQQECSPTAKRMHLTVLRVLALLPLVAARPQQDPEFENSENSLSEGEARVAIQEDESEATKVNYNDLGDPQMCGFSSKEIGRVAAGGGQATRRDYPWMAAIVRKIDKFHFCGGVVITSRHVLTAAHCVYNLNRTEVWVRLGEYDFTRDNDTDSRDYEIQDIRYHEDWDVSTYENDLALLLLGERVAYHVNVLPVCLPLPTQDFTNTTAVVAGWGTTTYGGPMSDVLLEVAVPVWVQEQCEDSFTQTIFSTVQCAASFDGGKDSCQGDSGGPLLSQRDDGRWVTIGVVSWGIRCGEKGKPGIYTRVNRYLDWIAPRIRDV